LLLKLQDKLERGRGLRFDSVIAAAKSSISRLRGLQLLTCCICAAIMAEVYAWELKSNDADKARGVAAAGSF
jgi:hypothetical protein